MLLDCSFQTHSSWQNQHGHTLNLQGRKRTCAHFHIFSPQLPPIQKKWINPSHNPNLYSIALIKQYIVALFAPKESSWRAGACLKERRAALLAIKAQIPQEDFPFQFLMILGVLWKKYQKSATTHRHGLGIRKKLGKNFAWDVVRQHPQQHVCVHGLKIGWNLSETVDMWAALYSEPTLGNHPCGIERLNCFLTAVETSFWPWALAFKTTRWSTLTSHSIGRGKAKFLIKHYKTIFDQIRSISRNM